MRLQTKLLTATALVFLGHFLTVEFVNHHQVRKDILLDVREDARVIQGILMSVRDVYQQQFLDHDIPVNDQTLGFLPAHALSRISKRFAKWIDNGLTFNNVSDHPWNIDNAADDIEMAAIKYFRQNEDEKERLLAYRNAHDEPFYHFAQPIWVKARCLKCHGPAEDIPAGLRKRYPHARQYEIGELRGVMSIKLPARMVDERAAKLTQQNIASHAAGFLIAFLVLSLFFKRTVLDPVSRLNATAREFAKGNYCAQADTRGNDELSHVAKTFDLMADHISQRETTLMVQRSLYEALSETNKSIIRLDSRQALFEKVCRIAVEQGRLKFAWIGLVDTESQTVKPVASAGRANSCLPLANLSLSPDARDAGEPVALTVHRGQPVIINDLIRDLPSGRWRTIAGLSRIGSAACFPVTSQDEVIGTFCLYADGQGFFSEDIVSLLEEMNNDVIFAVRNYQLAEAHERAHQRLEQSSSELERLNHQLSLLLESTGEGIFGVDTNGDCIFVNHAAAEILGFSREELIGKRMHPLTHHSHADGSSYEEQDCPIYAAFKTGEPRRIQNELFWRKDGSSFPVEYSAYPIRDGDNMTGTVTVFHDVSESQAIARKMSFLATHDTLTGLLNRYAFEQQLADALATVASEANTSHALCYMDLDQFKVINDTCGHVAGDAMLQMIAHLIQRTLRRGDIIARLGGDEFALLLNDCPVEQAERLGQKICDVVREFRFTWEDKSFATGVSIGVVRIDSDSESTPNVMSAADSACYVAKEMGRNRVYVHGGQDEEVARHQGEMQWVAEIRAAIDEHRLCLHSQSIVPLDPTDVDKTHFEVLLRMKGRDGQYIMPGAFLPAAERYDLMPMLDRWVIDTTLSWIAEAPQIMAGMAFCAINLSGQSLADDRLADYILDELDLLRVPADKVCFEITETAAVGRLDQALQFIGRLKKRGIRFALDDFGTGMSSFAYLKTLPVDYVKIDGSFIKDMLDDPVDRAMVASINEIGHLMGLATIAEYVENDEIKQMLIEMGVDYAQGFGIARPEPLDSMLPSESAATNG